MSSNYIDVIAQLRGFYCTLGVYVDFLLKKIPGLTSVRSSDVAFINTERKLIELKVTVKMLEEKLHEELALLDENIEKYVDCVTVIELTDELLRAIDSYLDFVGIITGENSVQ